MAAEGRPVLLIGQTGVGKTFIAQADRAARLCVRQIRAVHDADHLARESSRSLDPAARICATATNSPNPTSLILDDMGMRKMSSIEAQDLCEILEERSIGKSTLFTTQLPLDHWSEVIADPVIADAIRDRLSTPL